MSDDTAVLEYAEAGTNFGHFASLAPIAGIRDEFYEQLDELVAAEVEYVRSGYMPVSIDDFTAASGYRKPIDHLLRQQLTEDETLVFHARNLRDRFRELQSHPPVLR